MFPEYVFRGTDKPVERRCSSRIDAMKTYLRQILNAALSVALLGCLSAPADAQEAKKEDVVVWGISYSPDSKGTEAMVAEFQRRHPEYNVRVLSMGAGKMDPTKLMTSIVGNVAPDVIYQDRFTIGDWASRGAFLPLDDFLKNDPDPTKPTPSQYYPAAWEEASFDKKVYAIPSVADDRVLYWNKGIFRENADKLRAAGLDPDRPPKNWSELLAYSKVLTVFNADGTLKRAGYLPNFGNAWLYLYAYQMNASFMSADGKKCTLDTPASEKALQFMVDGYDIVGGYEKAKAFETGFLGKENDAFLIGKVAMKVDGDWILADLARYGQNVELATAPAPIPDDRLAGTGDFKGIAEKDKYITWIGGFSYAIPKGARNSKGGWEFIKFVCSLEGRMIESRVQKTWESGKGRFFIPRISAHIETNKQDYIEFKPPIPKFAVALKSHIDMMDGARIRPVTFVGQRLWDEHVRAIDNACYKKASPADALKQGQAMVQGEIDAVLEKNNYPEVNLNIPMAAGGVLLLIAGVAMVVGFRRQRMGNLTRQEAKWAYWLISPWVFGFLLFTVGPMLASLFFSFTQYNVLQEARWVGIKNYVDMATTDRELVEKAFTNAIYLAGVGVPLGLITGLSVAMLLNTATRGIKVYRTVFYMPAIVPTIAAAVLWQWLLYADPNRGLINGLWRDTIGVWLHLPAPSWINSEAWSKPALILMGIWGAGSGMILWLAGLKGISNTLYEAAQIDGANPTRQFWSITFPQLSPIVFFNLVMGFIGAMQEFDRVWVLKPSSEGPVGPGDSMLTPVVYLFRNGFGYFKMGFASALAWTIFFVILALTLIQFRLQKSWVHYEAEA